MKGIIICHQVDKSLFKLISVKGQHWHGPNGKKAVFLTDEDNWSRQRTLAQETVWVFQRLVKGQVNVKD